MLSLGAKIAYKAIGTLGMGVALYDATCVAKAAARKGSQHESGKHLESAYFNSRTLDYSSVVNNDIRKKVFDFRTDSEIAPVYGHIKGGIKGFFVNLGNNLPLVLCSAFALASKGFMAKAGAIGVGLAGVYSIARQGFGVGKKHPMN